MGALELIIVLTVVGFLMLAAEAFVPGMVLGILGILSLVVAIGKAYYEYGLAAGTFVLIGIGLVTMIGFIAWMRVFPHTGIGRRIMLQKSLVPGEGQKDQTIRGLVGQVGQAITPLRPAGTILIDGRRVDVVAESELIEAGSTVTVVHEEGMRVVVRKSTGAIPVVA
jgi:membrane-bound serine protease (ClpP class)